MKYIKPTQLKFAPWQKMLIDMPETTNKIAELQKLNRYMSFPMIRGYLDLMQDKGFVILEKNTEQKNCIRIIMTDSGKALQKLFCTAIQIIPIAGENNEQNSI